MFASTRQIYGRPQHLPVDEDHPIVPVDVNGINKIAGEWYHRLYGDVYGMRTYRAAADEHVRAADARARRAADVPRHLAAARARRTARSSSTATAAQRRDLTYVDDAVAAFLLAAARDEATGQVYNLGGDGHVSLLELAEIVVELAGRRQRHG